MPEQRRENFPALRRQKLKVGRAWAIKEALRLPVIRMEVLKAMVLLWATHSRLEPIRKVAETVRRHIDNILPYYQQPITNAMSEGFNG